MLTFDEIIDRNARLYPSKVAVYDDIKKLKFTDIAKKGLEFCNFFSLKGIKKGDRIALLSYNCIDYATILYATAKINAIIVPINFRLSNNEIIEIIYNCKPKLFIFQDSFKEQIKSIKNHKSLKIFYICLDKKLISSDTQKVVLLKNKKTYKRQKSDINNSWSLMYTSGTTGKPKGVLRSHGGYFLLSVITAIELKIRKTDNALLVMPMCHANSFNFFCCYLYAGASVTIYSNKSFNVKKFFKLIDKNKNTFTSLVPTHYMMILDYLKNQSINNDKRKKITFMISSSPARVDTKKKILKYFPKAKLYELYGSSESGWVTMLYPHEQFKHIGTVGKECYGSKPILILDNKKKEVDDGNVGELYASTPYNFLEYWRDKKITNEAFLNNYVTVGDLAYRNKDGFIVLVDRKKNMIISGGENIYPAEIENALGEHKGIKDIAVLGIPDNKWGEIVCAFVVLEKNTYLTSESLIIWAKKKIGSYKCPKKVIFLTAEELPRNSTGKIMYNILKEKYLKLGDF